MARYEIPSLVLTVMLMAAGCREHADPEAGPPRTKTDMDDWNHFESALAKPPTHVRSQDGKLELGLELLGKSFAINRPISLRVSLKNVSQNPIYVLRPFGDPYLAKDSGITLTGPTGKIDYRGPLPSRPLSPNAFAEIQPGESISDELELTADDFPGSDVPGDYSVVFQYAVTEGTKSSLHSDHRYSWHGEVTSAFVRLKRFRPETVE